MTGCWRRYTKLRQRTLFMKAVVIATEKAITHPSTSAIAAKQVAAGVIPATIVTSLHIQPHQGNAQPAMAQARLYVTGHLAITCRQQPGKIYQVNEKEGVIYITPSFVVLSGYSYVSHPHLASLMHYVRLPGRLLFC